MDCNKLLTHLLPPLIINSMRLRKPFIVTRSSWLGESGGDSNKQKLKHGFGVRQPTLNLILLHFY